MKITINCASVSDMMFLDSQHHRETRGLEQMNLINIFMSKNEPLSDIF